MGAKVWKLGKQWAGVSARGKRVVKPTKAAARSAVGLSKSRASRPKTKTKRSVRKTARRKRGRRRNFKIPIATVAGFLGGALRKAPSGRSLVDDLMQGNLNNAVLDAREIFAGIDSQGKFHWDWVTTTYTPMIVGALVSKFVGGPPLNLNRKLAKVPFIKI